jgi:hypothetical protein
MYFPPAIIGAMLETNPAREFSWEAMAATTPVGSGTEKLKCEEATGIYCSKYLLVLITPSCVIDQAINR